MIFFIVEVYETKGWSGNVLPGRLSETAALLFQAGYQGRDLQPLSVFSWKATFTGNHET